MSRYQSRSPERKPSLTGDRHSYAHRLRMDMSNLEKDKASLKKALEHKERVLARWKDKFIEEEKQRQKAEDSVSSLREEVARLNNFIKKIIQNGMWKQLKTLDKTSNTVSILRQKLEGTPRDDHVPSTSHSTVAVRFQVDPKPKEVSSVRHLRPRVGRNQRGQHGRTSASSKVCLCGANFPKRIQLERHLREKIKGRVHCDLCEEVFPLPSDAKRHKLQAHQGIKPYPCGRCRYFFANSEELRNHRKRNCSVQAKRITTGQQYSSVRSGYYDETDRTDVDELEEDQGLIDKSW